MHKLVEKINDRFNIQSGILDVLIVNKISGIELASNLYNRNALADYLSTLEEIDFKKNIDGLIWEIRVDLLEEALNIKRQSYSDKLQESDISSDDPF